MAFSDVDLYLRSSAYATPCNVHGILSAVFIISPVDGIEIQTGYTEPRKVIELIDNALQIAAVSRGSKKGRITIEFAIEDRKSVV